MPFTATTLALAFSTVFSTATPAKIVVPPPPQPVPKVETVKERVQAYFADIPIMVAISGCESFYRQYDTNGKIYRGEINNKDVGLMQINEHYHLDDSKALGYNIYSIEGNLSYARYLYEQEGTAPWDSSSYCWSQSKEARRLAANIK